MVYDTNAKKVAIKAIGTVESNFRYDAVNYNDPITVGVMQWFGTRAAGILNRIKNENPSTWVGVSASLVSSLTNNPANSSYWNSRDLTRAEGQSLSPVLLANQALQNLQAFEDLDAYKSVAINKGFDVDGNTQSMLFFFVMYHQSPRQALRVVASVGADSSLDRMLSGALNNSVLSAYKTRYRTAYTIIKNMDSSGVETPQNPSEPSEEGGDGGGGDARPASTISYISQVGQSLAIHHKDGTRSFAYPNGSGRYVIGVDPSTGVTVPPQVNPAPQVPPSADVQAKQNAVADWLIARVDRYAYGQGAGRLNPDVSGYTDCSALLYVCFMKVLNINVGTNTVAQLNSKNGRTITKGSGRIDESLLQRGDFVLLDWRNIGRTTVDHVELYLGPNQVIGHGGPDNGPDIATLQDKATHAAKWEVRRFIE